MGYTSLCRPFACTGIDGPRTWSLCSRSGAEARLVPDSRYILQDVQLVATVIEADFFHGCSYPGIFHLFRLKSVVVMPVTSECLKSSLVNYTHLRPGWKGRFVQFTHSTKLSSKLTRLMPFLRFPATRVRMRMLVNPTISAWRK